MNNLEFIKLLAARLGKTQREIRNLLDHSVEKIKNTLDGDLKLTIPRLGTFETHVRRQRKSYNPHYGKFVILPPKRLISFHSSSALKRHLINIKIDHEK